MKHLTRSLELGALFSLGVAYPVFEVLAASPEFFVARSTSLQPLIGLVSVLCIGLPLAIILIELLASVCDARAATAVHNGAIFLLLTATFMPWIKRLEFLGAVGAISMAVVASLAIVAARHRYDWIRSFFVALAPAILVVPTLFVLNEDVWNAVVPITEVYEAPTIDTAPPIVFIVFDEFPLNSLLDESYRIGRVRFPNFATLADDAYWFRNATTVSASTTWAVPSIVSGTYPVEIGAVPTRRYFPNNLFTLLSERYEITLFGRFLQLCPEQSCSYDLETPGELLGVLLADLSIVYLHVIVPPGMSDRLPPIVGDWRSFATRRMFRNESGERILNDRSSEFDRFLAIIGPEKQGRLYFLHSLLPHAPFQYLPSGRQYRAPSIQAIGLFPERGQALADYVQQRHLLQVGFVDQLVGKLIDRLKELGTYDATMVVITGDHGSSFREGVPRRGLRAGNYADIMLVPLFIKLPNQRKGVVSDRNIETVDIVPTIARELSIDLPYEVDGRSALATDIPDRDQKIFIQRNLTDIRKLAFDDAIEASFASWEHKLEVFGSGAWEGVFAGTSGAQLVGQPVTRFLAGRESPIRMSFGGRGRFDNVDTAATFLPLLIQGEVSGAAAPVRIAVAVNGRIAAFVDSYESDERWVFSTLIPAELLVQGPNAIELYDVDESGDDVQLLRTNPPD